MQVIEFTEPIHVVGLGLRTSNERAFEDIPAHWGRFHQSGLLASIPDRVGEDLFAVYTHFEHRGIDNLGVYSLIIGARRGHAHRQHHAGLARAPARFIDPDEAVFRPRFHPPPA